jgi:hypothetical protein
VNGIPVLSILYACNRFSARGRVAGHALAPEGIQAFMSDPDRASRPSSGRAAASRERRSASKIAAERQQRQARTRGIAIAAVAVVAVAVIALVFVVRQQSASALPAGTQTYGYVGAQHSTEPVDYAEHPPVGGVHDPVWQNCGFYAAPIANENAVHSLEHGAVWITYAPDLPEEQIATLRDLAAQQSYILVSPMDDLPSPVMASAWNRQVTLDGVDDPRLEEFIRAFRLSPQAPEPGASCTGGTAETV